MPGKEVYHFSNVNTSALQEGDILSFKQIEQNVTTEVFLKKVLVRDIHEVPIYTVIAGDDTFGKLSFSETEAI